MTKLNQQILDMLNNSSGHLTAEDTFLLAKKKKIKVSMASIYRILNKLYDEGLINKVTIPGQVDIFDKTKGSHEHLLCDKCGKVLDINIKNIKGYLEKNTNEKIDKYDLCIHYTCAECRKKAKNQIK